MVQSSILLPAARNDRKQSLRHGKPCHLPLHKGGFYQFRISNFEFLIFQDFFSLRRYAFILPRPVDNLLIMIILHGKHTFSNSILK